MKLASVVGARPQFIKVAVVARALADAGGRIEHRILHTGQHHDHGLSGVFLPSWRFPGRTSTSASTGDATAR